MQQAVFETVDSAVQTRGVFVQLQVHIFRSGDLFAGSLVYLFLKFCKIMLSICKKIQLQLLLFCLQLGLIDEILAMALLLGKSLFSFRQFKPHFRPTFHFCLQSLQLSSEFSIFLLELDLGIVPKSLLVRQVLLQHCHVFPNCHDLSDLVTDLQHRLLQERPSLHRRSFRHRLHQDRNRTAAAFTRDGLTLGSFQTEWKFIRNRNAYGSCSELPQESTEQ
mmetsp:Transcript_1157/g.1950  ORF Transcript_1157/g.1950 Transcript_1157/m.1950 type:complete len:220 (-) Transcript_1157:147-806(-)